MFIVGSVTKSKFAKSVFALLTLRFVVVFRKEGGICKISCKVIIYRYLATEDAQMLPLSPRTSYVVILLTLHVCRDCRFISITADCNNTNVCLYIECLCS